MELSYWKSRWQKDNTGWHMDIVYPQLPKVWPKLSLKPDARVLVPLCGKSLDINWLTEQGHYVIGAEASPKALREFMDQYPHDFSKDSSHGFTIYRSESIELWEGDFLKLPKEKIPALDVVYDKASIVALPPEMREFYAQKILSLCGKETQILLQTFDYEQDEMTGPPFSVDEKEIRTYFGHRFELELLHKQSKFDELSKFQQRGLSSYLNEKVYRLTPIMGIK